MEVTVAMFGAGVVVLGADDAGCIVRVGDRAWRFSASGAATPVERPAAHEVSPGPFTFGGFGKTQRLAWPGGGCSVKARVRVAYWGERYAAVVDTRSVMVVDGVANRQVRLEAALCEAPVTCAAGGGRLWIGGDTRVRSIELASLEALLDGATREIEAVVRPVYPLRVRDAAVSAKVVWMLTDEESVVNIGTRQIRIHGPYGLDKGMPLVMRDECMPGQFAVAEKPDGGQIVLFTPDEAVAMTIPIVRSRSKDPAAHTPAIATNDPRVDALLAELARDPDDDANRLVLADLLQELGTAFGPRVAEGEHTPQLRRDALGPLAHYLKILEYRGGLPWSALLVRKAPHDDALLDRAADDVRLGMLSTLRIAGGSREIYARLIGSPRAIGLRRVDVSHREMAQALVAAKRTELTHLYDVRFSQAPLVKLLAHETFDRVVEIEVVVQLANLAGLLQRVADDAHGVFGRVPRTLVLRERDGQDDALIEPVLARAGELPVAAIVVGGAQIWRRDAVQ